VNESAIMVLIIVLVIFVIIREFWCWYFKLNKMLELLNKSAELLERMDQNLYTVSLRIESVVLAPRSERQTAQRRNNQRPPVPQTYYFDRPLAHSVKSCNSGPCADEVRDSPCARGRKRIFYTSQTQRFPVDTHGTRRNSRTLSPILFLPQWV
jgi:hypothetical protein